MTIAVAIAALIQNNQILLKRERGDFIGLLGLPGGKIEENEFAKDAAIREIEEECGIRAEFTEFLGFISEHIIEDHETNHCLLHCYLLSTKDTTIKHHESGSFAWYDLGNINSLKDSIIPSDYPIIQRMVITQEKHYFESKIVKEDGQYHLSFFR